MELAAILTKLSPLSQTAQSKFTELSELIELPKGHLLVQSGKIDTSLYFIKKGIARAYSHLEDTEVTFWFGLEGDIVFPMRSYVENKPSYENIELLEDCLLYEVKIKDLQQLYQEDIEIANWGRKYAEHQIIKTETRLIARQFRTASERYHDLIENHPMLLQRVSLGTIASYLGITQVTLSRIRAER